MHLNSEFIKKHWLLVFPLVSFIAAIALLMFLDYFNLENIALFNQRGFFFDYTWKGRMFLLVFLMVFVFESMFNGNRLTTGDQAKPTSRLRIFLLVFFALIPLGYIIAINFFGVGQSVLAIGNALRGDYWRANSTYWYLILNGDWPLTLEYVVFSISSFVCVFAAFGKNGLKAFSISLTFVAAIAFFYFVDTWWPYGAFWPLQVMTRPTAAIAAGLLQTIGYKLSYIVLPGLASTPILTSGTGLPLSVTIDWPCAGIHSLFLYSLIILLFFKGSSISNKRRIVYFVVGAIGAFGANVLRIVEYFAIMVNQGLTAANSFHDSYGELFSAGWLFLYIFVILIIQKFGLVERALVKARGFHANWRMKENAH
jgi:thaumarchaeosortase